MPTLLFHSNGDAPMPEGSISDKCKRWIATSRRDLATLGGEAASFAIREAREISRLENFACTEEGGGCQCRGMASVLETKVRKFEPRDREVVRRLCCETGFLGKPIDPVFEDRELFADYLTSYYTDVEPESCFVMEVEGEVKGYLVGSRRPLRQKLHGIFLGLSLFVRAAIRYPRYNQATRDYIWWIIKNSRKEVPKVPRHTAHFHFNVLPEAQGLAGTREMLDCYLRHLESYGEKAVFGQIVTFESRRSAGALLRYGFRAVERREITKWKDKHHEAVYLTTVIRQLTPAKEARKPLTGGVQGG